MSEEETKAPKKRKPFQGAWKWRPVADKMAVGEFLTVETMNDARLLRRALNRRGKKCKFSYANVRVTCVECAEQPE